MFTIFLVIATLASYADKYILNPSGHTFATSVSDDWALLTSSEVVNILPSGLCEEASDATSQSQTYIQELINKKEVLVAKKEALQKFASKAPKAILAINTIQEQINEIESKLQHAPILYDITEPDLTS